MYKNLFASSAFCLMFFGLNIFVSAQNGGLKGYQSVNTPVAGFGEAFCAKLPDDLSVCKAVADRNEGNAAKYLVRRNEETLGEWKTEITMYSGVKDFEVLTGDLDGDGAAEIIVPQFDGASNGLGVNYYTLYILPKPAGKNFHAPLVLRAEEFGASGTFVFNSPTKTIDILITYWANDFELPNLAAAKTKAGGTYFIGRWFRYQNGKVTPVFDKPVLARRYLKSFQNERDNRESDKNYPFSWLQNKDTLQLKSDPEVSPKSLSTERGTITNYELRGIIKTDDDEEKLEYEQYTIKLDSGKTISYVFAPSDIDEDLRKLKKPFINRIGFLPPRLILPAQVGVSNVFDVPGKTGLIGKKVTLTTYPKDASLQTRRILWFDQK